MSRSATAGELAVLARKERNVSVRVKVQNGSGTMIDYSNWLDSGKISRDVDQPIDGCTLNFVRSKSNQSIIQSLSPLRTDSVINRLNDGTTYSPALDLNRIVTVEIATTGIGSPVSDSDYKLLFKGTIDAVDFAKSAVSVTCRDLGAPFFDRWIEAEATYGTGVPGSGVGGRSIQLVMQDILDAVFGAGVYPLYTPVSPGADLNTYRQQRMSVMDALQDLAQQIGWDVRFRWDDGTSVFRLTLSEPPRAKTTPDYTFGPSAYHDITELSLDITDIRNVITGSYRNANDLGNRNFITVSDATSISKYGRRFMLIQEADVSPIDSASEMTTMLNSALADLKEPKASQSVNFPLHWTADLWDLYRYSPNSVHYDSNQDIAVVELEHEFAPNYHRTTAVVRGTPIGQYTTWRGRGGPIGGPVNGTTGQAFAPQPFIVPLNTEANELTWNLRFNSLNGTGGGGTNLTYTIKRKKDFATETLLSSGNASAFPLDLSVTRDPKQNAVLTFRVTDAATGLFAEDKYTIPAYTPGFDSTGLGITSGTTESGGKPVNRLFAKPLPADPDQFDSVPDGVTYSRPLATRINAGKPLIDFSEAINLNKHSGNIARSAGDATVVSTIIGNVTNAGHAASAMQESGGKAINRIFAKALAADPDTLDSAADGSTYRKLLGVSSGLAQTASYANASVTKTKTEARNRCKVTLGGSNRTITTSSETALDWTAEDYDSNALHDNATNNTRITVPSGGDVGVWDLVSQVRWGADATGYRELRLLKNGSTRIATERTLSFSNGGEGPIMSIVGKDDAPSVGDYYTCAAFHNKGSDAIIASTESFFSATHLW